MSIARAREIHAAAGRTLATAVAVFGEYAAKLDRSDLRALPRVDGAKRMELAAPAIPNWESLFGSFDLCACEECAAAHGPAAYFVDILQFLDARGVKAALFARRPDLGEIELSCENTNTLVPTVDLVNEILEEAVARSPAFAPFLLTPALESDLAASSATAQLCAAFVPPLTPGARIEVLEPGKRWRIFDTAFAYLVIKTTTALEVSARSRQTSGASAARHASPQYINRAAYRELGDAVFPWTLPFDLPSAETNVYLTHLGVERRELIAALRDSEAANPHGTIRVRMAAARLGLSDTQRRIVTGTMTPRPDPEDFWGGATPATLATVRDVLDRAGLAFAELAELLATRFVDPAHGIEIRARAGERIDTCDPAKLEVVGVSAVTLARLHRFVRLQRTLGWSVRDLDRAIESFAEDSTALELDDLVLIRIDQARSLARSLHLSTAEALSLWHPIDTSGAGSLYRALFFDPAESGPRVAVFALRADGSELARADELAITHADALQAVFQLDRPELALLLRADDRLTLATLSHIHRHAVLARALGLSIGELSSAIELTQLAPFDLQRMGDAGKLAETIEAIRAAGFSIAELEYLLHHRAGEASPLASPVGERLQILSDLRDALRQADASMSSSIVRDRIAASLGVTSGLAGSVLARVKHTGRTAEELLVRLSSISGPLSGSNAAAQLDILEKAQKVVTIVQTIRLPESQLDWLFHEIPWLARSPDSATQVVSFSSWSSLLDVTWLRRELALEDAACEAILSRLMAVRKVPEADRLAARTALVATLVQWVGWSATDLEALLGSSLDADDRGLFKARVPEDYDAKLIVRVARAMALISRLGVDVRAADRWCNAELTATDAQAIHDAAEAKHGDEAWLRIAPQLQNELRDRQRGALVDYLCARPTTWSASSAPTTPRDLFAHFLIDVEMTACQRSSRLKQAIGSVQLFAQRALLGFEPGVITADARWEEWQWMKSFRTWEANRKIWLYPENFIEPELRDGKTPEFKELEEELLQVELDDAAAETAVRHYLAKLDELARLEVAGVYEDEDKVLHVFARTDHPPRRLYYRRRSGRTWTPWERVPLDVEGDHLIPVKWNRRLMLIWPTFAEKAYPKRPGGALDEAERYWEIRLAWGEYQQGVWSGPNLSEPVSFVAYQDESEILFDERVDPLGVASSSSAISFRPAGPLVSTDPGTRPTTRSTGATNRGHSPRGSGTAQARLGGAVRVQGTRAGNDAECSWLPAEGLPRPDLADRPRDRMRVRRIPFRRLSEDRLDRTRRTDHATQPRARSDRHQVRSHVVYPDRLLPRAVRRDVPGAS